ESEELFHLIFENAPVGIAHFNANGTITACNEHLAGILGAPKEKIVGTNMPVTIKDVRFKAALGDALKGKVGFFEGDYMSVIGGKSAYIRAIFAPIFASDNSIAGGISITEDISEHKKAEDKLVHTFEEKTILLNEVHHRVKNNLQIVSSLLNLQAMRTRNKEALEILLETGNRIHSMSLLHETIYRSGDMAMVDFSSYIENICFHIIRSYGPKAQNIKLELNMEKVTLDIDRAVPCGLIINELVSNSLKHAFPDRRPGQITVELKSLPNDNIMLKFADDGIGLPEGVEISQSETLGLKLISMLTKQLRGSIEIIREKGTMFYIVFRARKY
ncbi:MAG TPA: histidine kinase dimerization/phosphoacceptor domain -containing protein, partial [Candidatus Methanoperedens sp.]